MVERTEKKHGGLWPHLLDLDDWVVEDLLMLSGLAHPDRALPVVGVKSLKGMFEEFVNCIRQG